MNTQYQEKLLRADEIYQLRCRTLETKHPNKIAAIEITSESVFVGDGVAEALQQALNAGVEDPLFVKRIGSLDKFVVFQSVLTQQRLQAFWRDFAPAYTTQPPSKTSPFPGLMQKLGHDRLAIVLFSTEDGARTFLTKVGDPHQTVMEASLPDLQDFIHAQGARRQNLVVEMLP